jgi:hypothetical protein
VNHRVVEILIWVLIFGGILAAILGWFMREGNPALGGTALSIGGVAAAAGAVLIYVRSRMTDKP